MRVTTTKLYCDKCGKLLKEGFMKDMYNIPIAYKSRIWGFCTVSVTLCKACSKVYFEATKQFLQKVEVNDNEEG